MRYPNDFKTSQAVSVSDVWVNEKVQEIANRIKYDSGLKTNRMEFSTGNRVVVARKMSIGEDWEIEVLEPIARLVITK